MKLLDRLFKLEEINGANRCPTYLYRWTLLKLWHGRGIYLHHFIGDDWSLDLHDHPKRFISIGLYGKYLETTPDGSKVYRAPWMRTFPCRPHPPLEYDQRWGLLDACHRPQGRARLGILA